MNISNILNTVRVTPSLRCGLPPSGWPAPESGTRNAALNSEAYGLGRLIAAGLLDGQAVADELAAAAIAAGLTPREIESTLCSAFGARGLL